MKKGLRGKKREKEKIVPECSEDESTAPAVCNVVREGTPSPEVVWHRLVLNWDDVAAVFGKRGCVIEKGPP